MSYLVLARKYRPRSFDEVVGQPHITRTLRSAIASGRIAHAYLFTGTRGVGKTTVARALAKGLNCEKGPTPSPCNECKSCVEIARGSSVDVFEIDGASNTGVDDVRELRENVKYLPQSSRYKIVIIDEVHMLSNSAFNALLKTLEEPPPHVVFMFATTEVHKIPDTILSRCQQYDFKTISLRDIHDYLKRIVAAENLALGDDQLVLIARKAEGSMRDALSYLDQALSFAGEAITTDELVDILGILDRRLLLRLSAAVLAGRTDDALDVLERLSAVAWDIKQFYGDLLEHFRNLVVAKISKKPDTMMNVTADELEELVRQAKDVTYETLENLFSILVDGEEEVLRSQHPRLVLEMLLIRLATARPVRALDELALEIAKLRGQLAGGAPIAPASGSPGSGRSGPSGGSSGGTRAGASTAPPAKSDRLFAAPNGSGASRTVSDAPVAPPVNGASNGSHDDGGPGDRFLQSIKSRDPYLSQLIRAGSVDVRDNLVVLSMPKGLHYDETTSQKKFLEQLASEVFGETARIMIDAFEQPEKTQATDNDREQRAARDKRRAELYKLAGQDPTVRMILKEFPGTELTVQEGAVEKEHS